MACTWSNCAFGDPERDPVERTISVAFYALIDIYQYEQQLSGDYKPEWFSLKKIPSLIFDHEAMVEAAKATFGARKQPFNLFYLNCCPSGSPFPWCSSCMKVSTKRNLTSAILVARCYPADFLVRTDDKEKAIQRRGLLPPPEQAKVSLPDIPEH